MSFWGIAGTFSYLAIAIASTWLGYWWFVAFVASSVLGATLIAARDLEYWPVVHPQYGFFIIFPALFAIYRLVLVHPLEWGQWLAYSTACAFMGTAALTLSLRRYIDREWAVLTTLGVSFVFWAFFLDVANTAPSGQERRFELAYVVSESVGGYRQGPPRLTVSTASRARQTFFLGWPGFLELHGETLCVAQSEGALGWAWSTLTICPVAVRQGINPDEGESP
ncbi:MAG: hypothetical protein AB7O98_17970 [Hyphomonadaceae bacterium]